MKKFYSSASYNSTWRGYECYLDKKIINAKKITDTEYIAIAIGSNSNKYNVYINLEKPKSSTCDCPHAKDNKIICKHKVALFFTIYPQEAEEYKNNEDEAQKEYEDYQEQLTKDVDKIIKGMSKAELTTALETMVYSAPDWLYDQFINEFVVSKRRY